MNKITILILVTVLGLPVMAEEGWEKSFVGGLNVTQTGFDNWVAGGENSFSWQLNLNYSFNKDAEKINLANSGKFSYGATQIGEAEMKKSVDEISHESVLTYKLGTSINPFAAFTGETQVAAGYVYSDAGETQVSAFMDPGYFRESFGVGYAEGDLLKTRLGLALKQTVAGDYDYANDPETADTETFKNEVGAESVTDVIWKVSESSVYTSKLELFSNFKGLDQTDVKWDNILTVKVSEYINVNMNLKLIYDFDQSVKRQIKQSMALGLNYTFI